jgi:hypothetical protein
LSRSGTNERVTGSADIVRVVVDRDSVHAGDDVDSHREVWDFPSTASVDDLLVSLSSHYLASVAGDVMWTVYLDDGRSPGPQYLLAVIYVDYPGWLTRFTRVWSGRQLLVDLRDLDQPSDELRIHAGYPSGVGRMRLATVDQIKQGGYYTGAVPHRQR